MNKLKVVSWCQNRTLHWIFSSLLTSVLYTILRAYEQGTLNWGTLLYCLLDATLLYQAAVSRLMETEVLYAPNRMPGCNKAQAEALLRSHCELSE
ncbi:hypothetical protein BCD67_02655 [Oscillatoriales cyanobacterium USR001]|nr:hypothetical protein BCD67_02655 [Oscillatoriales cyanobacterium USR001]